MDIKVQIHNFKRLIKNNSVILENYFFMTILQILNSFFYLLIYPYLIRVLGTENYGLFVFATSISTYFSFFVNFGFDLPATKAIAENPEKKDFLEDTLSSVFSAKLYLFSLATILFIALLLCIPFFRENVKLFVYCYLIIFSSLIFPQWFFQGIQNMRVVTYIQLLFKIVSLPLIFIFVKKPNDLEIYAFIVTLSSIVGGIVAYSLIIFKYKLKIRLIHFNKLKIWFNEGMPFFLSNSAGIIKEQSITIIIGVFFGMKDVAVYDLANKLILIPRTLFMSINAAIFPKLIRGITKQKVKRIIKLESLMSISVVVAITLFGKFAVVLLGGESMLTAYPLAILLSVTVITWLVVGAYISFVFIPAGKYFLATKNQLVALLSFGLYLSLGLLIFNSIYSFAAAIALSGLTEILYCKYVTKKYELL